MKKLLALSLILTVVFISCGGNKNAPASQAASQGGRKYTALPYGDKSKDKVTVFVGGIGGRVTSFDYGVNTLTTKVVDDTGIMMEFVTAGADSDTRLNLLLNSGDYPDLIISTSIGLDGMEYYASQGIFLPLDDYNALSYPNIAQAFQEYPALNDILRASDTKLYGFPNVNDCIQCIYGSGRGWYYMPWVRDNGRKVPETLDEFTDYLRWVRDNDLNGNGNKNDEIPLAFSSGDLGNAIDFFARSYMPWNNGGLALYNGVVTEQYRMNEFRQCLAYITALYKEGLIKEDSLTMTYEQLQALARSATPVLGVHLNSWNNGVVGPSGRRFAEDLPLTMLKGPAGLRYGSNGSPWSILNRGGFVTNKSKDPELAIALFDYMLNWFINNEDYGPKGEGWDDADPGAANLVGGPALYKFLISRDDFPVNHTWNQANPSFRNLAFRQGQQVDRAKEAVEWINTGNPALLDVVASDPDYIEIMFNYTPLVNVPIKIPAEYFIPPLVMQTEDSSRLADINAVLGSYKNQAWAEFIAGIRNINSDADWNAYLADLDRINSRELVSIYQKYIK